MTLLLMSDKLQFVEGPYFFYSKRQTEVCRTPRRRAALATALQILATYDLPNIFGPHRHVQVLHSVRRQRIDDRVDDRRGRAEGAGFAHAFDAPRIYRRERFRSCAVKPC